MIKIKNIAIIGTSHVSRASIKEIKDFIEQHKPQIIAIEIDKKRLDSLLKQHHTKLSLSIIKKVGIKAFLFLIIGSLTQKIIGKKLNVMPGSELYTAYLQAKKYNLKIYLIDQDLEVTLKRFSKNFSMKDFFSIFKDFFKGIFTPKKQLQQLGLEKIVGGNLPDDKTIERIIIHLKKNYPGIYKTLIHERNNVMASNLLVLHQKFPNNLILAVVGKAHETGIANLLKKHL